MTNETQSAGNPDASGSRSYTFTAQAGPPGPPTGSTATAGSSSATVSWTAPAVNGGAAVTGYTAMSNPGSKTCTTTGPLTCAVGGLTPGTAYTFTVTATNSAGTGAPSAPSNSVTPYTVPGPPTGVSATIENGTSTVSWAAPVSDGGLPVTGYVATASPGGRTCSASTTSCAVFGLANGTSYTFTVVAQNASGAGAASAASSPVTPDASVSQSTNTWWQRAPMPTARRSLAVATGLDGRIFAIGGIASQSPTSNKVEAYDPVSNTWTTKAPLPTSRFGLAAATGSDGMIYAVGGSASGELRTLEAYNPATNTWTTKTAMPTARSGLSFVAAGDGTIYAIGGSAGGRSLATVEAYNPATNTWSTKAPMVTARTLLGSTEGVDGKIYALGGQVINPAPCAPGVCQSNSGAVEVYDAVTNTWAQRTPMPVPNRPSLYAAVGTGDWIYAIGGEFETVYVQIFSPSLNEWTYGRDIQTLRGSLAATKGTDGKIYAVGGRLNGGTLSDAMEAYVPRPISNTDITAPTTASVRQQITVRGVAMGSESVPVGFIGIFDDGNTVCSGTADATGAKECNHTFATAGTHQLRASFHPQDNYLSSLSAPLAVSVSASVPGTPLVYGASPGNTSVRVFWRELEDTGGSPITSYRVNAAPGGRTCTTTLTYCTVTGLTNGTTYTFTVTATNSAGTGPPSSPTSAVMPRFTPADFDANATTDIAVYRPSTGVWYVRNRESTGWGADGDIPVPGDYDFNGTTDIAVYRPSTGVWYVRDGVITGWGASGDIPVPGDYDGNGTTDIAVYRPSTGVWYVRDGVITGWGASGDIPVPGDYDGNGTIDIAVYRPSTGVWYVRDGVITGWGASGDIPVPGDYDGNGTTDIAVYRPSTGVWYVRNGVITGWGASGDIPVPGDYDGNGTTDIAVYRPSTGVWYMRNVGITGWGANGDIPVVLPFAIGHIFFSPPFP